jgi:hypothetical protein
VFTARYALSPYIKQIRFVFKGLNSAEFAHSFYLCILCHAHNKKKGGFSLKNIKRYVFIMETDSVSCEAGNESLTVIRIIIELKVSQIRYNLLHEVRTDIGLLW